MKLSRLCALVLVVVASPLLCVAKPAAAQEPETDLGFPDGFLDWDTSDDGTLQPDEWEAMSVDERAGLRSWLFEEHSDAEGRDWVDHHVAVGVKPELDVPEESIASQLGQNTAAEVGERVDEVTGQADDLTDVVGDAASDLAGGVADSAFDSVASRVGQAAADLTGHLGEEMARTGRPQLEADWYRRHYQRMLGWAGLLLLPLALTAVAGAVAQGDSAKVGHTLMQVPIAYLLGVLAISVVSAASGLAAAMSRSLVPGMQESSHDLGARVTELWERGLSPGLVFLLGLLIAIAALVTLIWLLLAEAAVYAVVLFIPLAFAGRVWEPARDWGRKLLTLAFSLVAAKVVIFAIWALTVDGLAEATAGDVPLRSALSLAALLLMTALAPTSALRLVPMLEGADRTSSPGGAVRSGLSSAYYGAGLARMGSAAVRSGRSGGGTGGRLQLTGQIGGAAARAPTGASRDALPSASSTPRPADGRVRGERHSGGADGGLSRGGGNAAQSSGSSSRVESGAAAPLASEVVEQRRSRPPRSRLPSSQRSREAPPPVEGKGADRPWPRRGR